MVRPVGLDHDLSWPLAPASSASHLLEELVGALRGAEVGQVKRRVGVDHRHQRHLRVVETLGDHLRAEEYARALDALEGGKSALVAPLPLRRVGVHSNDRHAGDVRGQLGLDALRSRTELAQVGAVAPRTRHRHGADGAAVMAGET